MAEPLAAPAARRPGAGHVGAGRRGQATGWAARRWPSPCSPAPSAAGSWAAAVGVPSLGLAAAAGFGVDLGRLVLVAPPPAGRRGPRWWPPCSTPSTWCWPGPPPAGARRGDARRLAARARERGSVLVRLGSPAGLARGRRRAPHRGGHARGRASGGATATCGPAGSTVAAGGRRGAARPRRADAVAPRPRRRPRLGPADRPPLAEVAPAGAGPPVRSRLAVHRRAVRTLVVWCADWPVVARRRPGGPSEPAAVRARQPGGGLLPPRPGPRGCDVGHAPAGGPGPLPRPRRPRPRPRPRRPGLRAGGGRAGRPLTPRVEVVAPGHARLPHPGPVALLRRRRGPGRPAAGLAAEVLGPTGHGPAWASPTGPSPPLLAARAAPGHRARRRGAAGASPAFLAPLPVGAARAAPGRPTSWSTCSAASGCAPSAPWPPCRRRRRRPLRHRRGGRPPPGRRARRAAARRPHPPPDLAARVELDPPAERVETAAFVARALADELAGRPRRRWPGLHPGARRGRDRARRAPRAAVAGRRPAGRRRSPPAPSPTGSAGSSTGWLDGTAGAPADRRHHPARLVPDEVVAATGRQLGFWGGAAGADERAVRAVARVQGLLGPEAVPRARVAGRAVAGRAGGAGPGRRRRPRRGARRRSPAAGWPAAVAGRAAGARRRPPCADGAGAAERASTADRRRPVGVDGRGAAQRRARPGWRGRGRWWRGPGRGRWRSGGGTPAATAAGPASRSSTADGAAHLLALEGGRWRVEATYD